MESGESSPDSCIRGLKRREKRRVGWGRLLVRDLDKWRNVESGARRTGGSKEIRHQRRKKDNGSGSSQMKGRETAGDGGVAGGIAGGPGGRGDVRRPGGVEV